jgi:predicted N-formylglutamate amidohydrolase
MPACCREKKEGVAVPANTDVADAAASARLAAVYSRLLEIDADGALARAATILNGLSFEPDMIGVRRVLLFS